MSSEYPYQNLANAIVLTAAEDYRDALKILKRNPYDRDAAAECNSIKWFFRSGWFAVLTDLDPEALITELNREILG